MIKPLIILFNTVSVFLFSFFFGDEPVSVTSNFPKNAKPNTEFVAEVTIKKGNVSGFSKLQLDLPQGFTAKEMESKSGNFSFSPNIAKIIWMATPTDQEFTVKFVLMADASAIGVKTISGKFSYISNNNKEVAEMAPVEITIGDAPAETVVTNATSITPTTSTQPQTTETNTTIAAATNITTNSNGEPNSNVICERIITKGSNPNQFNVDVKIKKPGIKGFAKFQEVLPAGFTAKGGKTNGSSFSVSDGKAKFVWVSLPAEDELSISFVLEKGAGASADATLSGGEFSYLENDQTKKVKLNTAKIDIGGTTSEPLVSNAVTTETTTPITTNTTAVSTESVTAVTTSTITPEPIKTQPDVTSNNLSKKEGNVSYLVQIGAFRNAIASDVLSKKFNISETIKSEMAEGYSKFMVGNFAEYKQARSHRETIKQKGCNSAFVVAYNNSKRITVQEALMITGQKWFK